MSTMETEELTRLLNASSQGDEDARAALLEAIRDQLHREAQRHMRRQPRHHTMWPTDLVDETYAKLFGRTGAEWRNRRHFFQVVGRAMESILVDHARGKGRLKRTAPGEREPVETVSDTESAAVAERAARDLDVHEALKELEESEPDHAEIVRLRYYAGLSMEEIASGLDVPKRTVERRWAYAKAWLGRRLQ